MTDTLTARETQYLFDTSPLPALVLDHAAMILGFNKAFAQLAGETQVSDLIGQAATSLAAGHPLHKLVNTLQQLEWQDQRGQVHYLHVEKVQLPGDTPRQVRFFIDRSDRVRLENANTDLEEKLRQNSLTDPVTGLLNQRGIVLALEPQIARCRRYNSTLSIIMMAVDAPVQRDRLLTEIAHLLKDQLRWADLVGCTDEQEFMLALPETAEQAAMQLTEKLKPLLEQTATQHFQDTSIWSCYGIAGWRKSDNAQSLLQRASTALAQARNDDSANNVAL